MIGNNNDIRGITIDNKEYKISQYAADTHLQVLKLERFFRKFVFQSTGFWLKMQKYAF